jgi:hypothetical protein
LQDVSLPAGVAHPAEHSTWNPPLPKNVSADICKPRTTPTVVSFVRLAGSAADNTGQSVSMMTPSSPRSSKSQRQNVNERKLHTMHSNLGTRQHGPKRIRKTPQEIAILQQQLAARGVLLAYPPTNPTNDIQTVRDALQRARDLLARESDPQKRDALRVQVEHLEFKLQRAINGVYDKTPAG